jgi:hypothetical protein
MILLHHNSVWPTKLPPVTERQQILFDNILPPRLQLFNIPIDRKIPARKERFVATRNPNPTAPTN